MQSTFAASKICIVGRLIMVFSSFILFSGPVFAQHPPPSGTQAPPKKEQDLWNKQIDRLKSHKTLRDQVKKIYEALDSLSKTVNKTFECPPGSKVDLVRLDITTSLVRWDPNLALKNTSATYKWNAVSQVKDKVKTITAKNWVMMDPGPAEQREADSPIGPILNETVAYHELLHAQLLIDEMNKAQWQKKACSCIFDGAASDGKHVRIDPFEQAYGAKLAKEAGAGTVNFVRVAGTKADKTGNFDILLGPAEKSKWKWTTYLSAGPKGENLSNVEGIKVTKEDGKFHIKGKLSDKNKEGFFFIAVDPPASWTIGGTEQAVVVSPGPAVPVPALATWGYILLLVLLPVCALWFLYKRPA